MSPDSVGYYVCEVSSSPPASLRHELSILSPPTATILKEERTYKIDAGRELALVCTGTGDPKPVIKWKREVMLKKEYQRPTVFFSQQSSAEIGIDFHTLED